MTGPLLGSLYERYLVLEVVVLLLWPQQISVRVDLRSAFGRTLLSRDPGLRWGAASVLWLDHSLRQRRLQTPIGDGHCT